MAAKAFDLASTSSGSTHEGDGSDMSQDSDIDSSADSSQPSLSSTTSCDGPQIDGESLCNGGSGSTCGSKELESSGRSMGSSNDEVREEFFATEVKRWYLMNDWLSCFEPICTPIGTPDGYRMVCSCRDEEECGEGILSMSKRRPQKLSAPRKAGEVEEGIHGEFLWPSAIRRRLARVYAKTSKIKL